jgi:hypothetical protein
MLFHPRVHAGNGLAFMAGRLSYTFGLTGPCVPTNTACSSSLVAAHLAARALGARECAFAIAAGANAALLPLGATSAMTQVQALSPDGRCKAFGAEADGYGRGEGFAAAIIEPAAAAVSAPLALLAGSAVNQDGRSSGLTAPHGPSQAALVAAAMAEAGVQQLDFVATHGTGTPLGDPIESGALRKAMPGPGGAGAAAAGLLTLGAVKAATGHLEGTAGLAGLAQALVALRERAALPLRYRALNPWVAGGAEGWGLRCRWAAGGMVDKGQAGLNPGEWRPDILHGSVPDRYFSWKHDTVCRLSRTATPMIASHAAAPLNISHDICPCCPQAPHSVQWSVLRPARRHQQLWHVGREQ